MIHTFSKQAWSPERMAAVRYNDLYLRLGFPIIFSLTVLLYGSESLQDRLLAPRFYLEGLLLLCCSGLTVEWVALSTRLLDRHNRWETNIPLRASWQLLIGVMIPSIAALLFSACFMRLKSDDIMQTTFMAYAFPLIVVLIILLNSYYCLCYIYCVQQQAQQKLLHARRRWGQPSPEGHYYPAAVRSLPQSAVPLESAAYFYSEKDRCYAVPFSGQRLRVRGPLGQIQDCLNPGDFYRVNRKLIVKRSACRLVQPLPYGRLLLVLRPSFTEPVHISRLRATAFLAWYKKSRTL